MQVDGANKYGPGTAGPELETHADGYKERGDREEGANYRREQIEINISSVQTGKKRENIYGGHAAA